MSTNKTYIEIINEFWASDLRKGLRNSTSLLYLYILNRINRNYWNPVTLTDRELARECGIGRRMLSEYKMELAASGLVAITVRISGKRSYTEYSVDLSRGKAATAGGTPREVTRERSPEWRGNAPVGSAEGNRTGGNNAPVNGSVLRHTEPETPILYNKTDKRQRRLLSTTTTIVRADAHDVDGDVQNQALTVVKNNTDLATVTADYLGLQRRRAAEQGAEVLKAFFDPTCTYTIQCLCMQNHVSTERLEEIARQVVADWVQDGRTHDSPSGCFDIRDALKHLRQTIPKKLAALAAADDAPKTRQQKRQELIDVALRNMRDSIEEDNLPAEDAAPEPF